jgi:hypothetical protein
MLIENLLSAFVLVITNQNVIYFIDCCLANMFNPLAHREQHHFGGPLVGQLSGNTLMAPQLSGTT